MAPREGRRENFWGISCEKSRFYAKKSYFSNFRGGRTATSNWPVSYGSWHCVPLQILNNNDYFSFFNKQMCVRCARVSEWWWLLLMYMFCIYFKMAIFYMSPHPLSVWDIRSWIRPLDLAKKHQFLRFLFNNYVRWCSPFLNYAEGIQDFKLGGAHLKKLLHRTDLIWYLFKLSKFCFI
jgi:hypothetical protein